MYVNRTFIGQLTLGLNLGPRVKSYEETIMKRGP